MSVTIKQIALRTGLSIPTVGNVLGRGGARYSAKTRQRVLQAADEMGYRPNSSARAVRQGRIGCAALVLSRTHEKILSHIPFGLLDGLDDELSRQNMHLAVSRLTDEQLSRDDVLPKVLREYMADGMIVNYTHEIPPRMLEVIRAHQSPAVWINARLDSSCVYPDDRSGAESATAKLIARGHRRIAMVHFISPYLYSGMSFDEARARFHYSVMDRAEGYARAMRAAGLSPRIAHHDRFIQEIDSVEAVHALLSGPDRPTAVLLYSEVDTPAVLVAATRLGLRIPNDLTVLEFHPVERWVAGLRVPVVPIPTAELGRQAVRMLLNKIAAPSEPCPPLAVPYESVPLDAIAPPDSST